MMKINGTPIGEGQEPYIIAELSANHNGNLERAFNLIDQAHLNGASAIKIQTYTAETMTIESKRKDFFISSGPWKGKYLFDLYKWAETSFELTQDLFGYAKQHGVTIFSTPFDETAVELLEKLDAPAYKVASFELIDLPLIKLLAETKKPLIMSTGMATESEIADAIDTAKTNGAEDITLLHCISEYPAPIESMNLNRIRTLIEQFQINVGLSDHTLGNNAANTAIALGATVIEKHFTLSRTDGGADAEFSMEPHELRNLRESCNQVWHSLGSGLHRKTDGEILNRQFRRSLYFVKPLKKGECILHESIRRIRPGFGIEPKYFEDIIGRTVIEDVEPGQPVTWELVSTSED